MLHLVKYRFLQIIRMRALMFWALLFPVILGTLYYFGFWKNANCPQLEMIDVAVVAEEDSPGFDESIQGSNDRNFSWGNGKKLSCRVFFCTGWDGLHVWLRFGVCCIS